MARLPGGTSRRGSLIRRGRGTIANVAFPKLACLRPQIGHALNPAAPAAITRLQTWIAAWANQVVDMGLLDADSRAAGRTPAWVKANPPSCARPCEHRAILAGPGFYEIASRPKMLVFTSFRISASAGQNLAD